MIKHIKKIANSTHAFASSKHFTLWGGVGNGSIECRLHLGF